MDMMGKAEECRPITHTGSQPSYVIRISPISPAEVLEPGGMSSGRLTITFSYDTSFILGITTHISTRLNPVQFLTG